MNMPTALLAVVLPLAAAVAPAVTFQDAGAAGLVPPSAQDVPSEEAALQRVAELEGATDLGEELRLGLIEVYRQIANFQAMRRTSLARGTSFGESMHSAPQEAALARERLEALREEPAGDMQELVGLSGDEVQQLVTRAQAEGAALRQLVTDLERRLTEERGRPARIDQQLLEVRALLTQLAAALSAPAPAPEAPEAERAARWLLLARQRAREAELAMLEQELLSQPVRVQALEAGRELEVWRTAAAERRLEALEELLSQRRRVEADLSRAEAERLRREAMGKHPLIVRLTGEIAATTRVTQDLLERTDAVRAERQAVDGRLARIVEDHQQTQRSLDLRITNSLGTVLLELRRKLPTARSFRKAAAERSDAIMSERLAMFRDERELLVLADPARALERQLEQPEAVDLPAMDATGREALVDEVRVLLGTQLERVQEAQRARHDYLTAIGNLEARETELQARAGELAAILDERLLWIPNAPPMGRNTLLRLPGDLAWLASGQHWGQSLEALRKEVREGTTSHALVALPLLLVWALRRRMRERTDRIAALVGKLPADSILLSLQALALAVLRVAPLPALGALIGWRLSRMSDTVEASRAVGVGLVSASTLAFVMLALRELCREDGVARVHFQWRARSCQLVRRHLAWYQVLALPACFLVAMMQAQSDPLLRYSLGRIVFVVLMLGSLPLAYQLFHPRHGLYVAEEGEQPTEGSAWLRRTRGLWLPLGLAVPSCLAGLAVTGHSYAALQLESRLNLTVLIILAALLLHGVLLRMLLISKRRLAMRVALEKRAAALKNREGGADAEAAVEPLEALDVLGITGQTRDLLRVVTGSLVLLGVWLAWVGVLPALGVLNEVDLWEHTILVDGLPAQAPVTLAHLAMALLLAMLTVAAARNMPGFLEIALLQRLPLEPGARYATRTLALYVIVATGVALAFNAIGVGWASVQWLVAALTVGLGFGLQEIFANFVSGLIILLERPVRVGDTVTVSGVSGVVSRIRMRATTITDWNRRELVVPNKAFITNELVNWSLSDPVLRLEIAVGIAYGSDTVLAHRTLMDVAHSHPLVLPQPSADVFFLGFGDSALDFEVRVFVAETSNNARSRILHDLHMAIDRACRERGITIAFPQRDLHFQGGDGVLRVALESGEPPTPPAG